MLHLGKQPATRDERDLRLGTYLTQLPAVPYTFGHQGVFPTVGWQMLGNDEVGDCAVAGPAHEHMLWRKAAHPDTHPSFATAGVLADYSAISGYRPGDPSTDVGCNVRDVAKYRHHTGIVDAHGHRHKIAAYLRMDQQNVTHLKAAVYLFGTIGLGILVPDSAMAQFNVHQPWDVVPNAQIEGGHYVPLVGWDGAYWYVVTWGTLQRMTPRFLMRYCDEAWAYIARDYLASGRTPEGFNMAQLHADLAAVR